MRPSRSTFAGLRRSCWPVEQPCGHCRSHESLIGPFDTSQVDLIKNSNCAWHPVRSRRQLALPLTCDALQIERNQRTGDQGACWRTPIPGRASPCDGHVKNFDVTARNRVNRYPKRGAYDAETIHPILDEALICHVSFALDGQPFIIPTIHARQGDRVLMHGLKGGRTLDHIEAGNAVALAVSIVDGLVCARTAFNHSMNYRSAVIFGTGRVLEEPHEKLEALRCLTERAIPGRWDHIRAPSEKELKATSVVAIGIDGASAKIRQRPPGDDGADLELPVWAGVLPLPIVPQAAETDPKQTAGYPVPDYMARYRRSRQ